MGFIVLRGRLDAKDAALRLVSFPFRIKVYGGIRSLKKDDAL